MTVEKLQDGLMRKLKTTHRPSTGVSKAVASAPSLRKYTRRLVVRGVVAEVTARVVGMTTALGGTLLAFGGLTPAIAIPLMRRSNVLAKINLLLSFACHSDSMLQTLLFCLACLLQHEVRVPCNMLSSNCETLRPMLMPLRPLVSNSAELHLQLPCRRWKMWEVLIPRRLCRRWGGHCHPHQPIVGRRLQICLITASQVSEVAGSALKTNFCVTDQRQGPQFLAAILRVFISWC